MADSNEILREIALMEGIELDDDKKSTDPIEESSTPQEELADGREEESKGEEEQASSEAAEGSEVLEEEEPEEPLEDRYKRLLEAHNSLAAQMMELRERGLPGVASPPTPAPVATPPVSAPPPAQAQPTPFSLDDALLERALVEDDPKALKEVLVGVVNYFSRELDSRRESMVRDLPAITQNVARQQLILMKAVDNFYSANPDLLPHQAVVGMVANDIVAKEPGLAMPDVLAKAEAEARKVLGLKKQAQKVEQAAGRGKPAFAPVKSARKPVVGKLEGTRGEIARMQDAKW